MSLPEKQTPTPKENLHARNAHRLGYDFKLLIKTLPQLAPFVKPNEHGVLSINFSDAEAVKMLNKALLQQYYGIKDWDIPEGYLCPPVPGRADYIHYIADLLAETNGGTIPSGKKMKVLDVGTGANGIYPIIGSSVYGWQFVGVDIDPIAIRAARDIVNANNHLRGQVLLRPQTNRHNIFKGIILNGEGFDITMCNPPFHSSTLEAQLAAVNKWNKIDADGKRKSQLNFGGQKKELWYPGGEAAFIRLMVEQSVLVRQQCLWFTTLVSKKDTLPGVYKALKKAGATDVRTINMSQGQKNSRIVAWTFFDEAGRKEWAQTWWK